MEHALDLLSEGFAERMMMEELEPIELIRDVVYRTSAPSLTLSDYAHIQDTLDILCPYLRNAVKNRRAGVNVYLYGPPGTGKTELAKVLAREVACDLYEVTCEDDDSDVASSAERMKAFSAAQNFFARRQAVILFDEVESVFGREHYPGPGAALERKAWINRILETNPVPAIWISNSVDIDGAFLRRFDAVFLNNTIGDIFSTAAVRDGFASYIAGGGGLIGNHATTVTATDWKEFGDILGGRGASHRMTDERVSITVEDSANPITRVFGAGPFEYADEFFRFQPPYSRENVRVLLSVDPIRTNLNQGRCFGRCYRDDNDYPVAWIKRYGKGRVFYTTLGHNPYVFEDSKMLAFFLAGIQYALGDLTADDTPRPRAPADLEAILGELTKWDRGQNQAPVRRLERALASGGNFEPRLAGFLASGASAAAKGEVCRQLADVGTAASVPALAKLLEQADTGEMARYALERIPDPSAVTALREAMAAAPNVRAQTAILYSLGRRRDEASVGTLSNLLDSSDASVAAAAANALGLIGSPEAERALASVPLNRVTEDALLNLADHASDERAVTIYRKLADAKFPSEIRTSALRALARRTGAQSVPLLKDACTEASADVRTAAIAELARLDGGAVAAVYPNLDAAGKIEALSQLAVSNASSAGPLLREALSADSPELRAAGIQGLAEAGTDADVVRLLEIAARAGSRADGVEARLALARMTARGVDAALIAALKSLQAPAIRTEVVRAIGERGAAEATDALIAVAAGGDPNLRTAALRAIRNLAKPEHAAALVDLLVKAGEEDRKDAELALSAAVRRAEQPDVKPVVTAYRGASDSETKASLLSVMASTGSARALPVLREATQSNDAALQRAAVAGLAEWPSPEPMNDLLGVAKSSAAEPIKVLALRGYIKLAQVPVGRAPAETAKLLRSAMESANRPEEKKLAIAALQRVPDAESLAIVRAAVADPAVAAEAKLAVATLERSLAAPRRNE